MISRRLWLEALVQGRLWGGNHTVSLSKAKGTVRVGPSVWLRRRQSAQRMLGLRRYGGQSWCTQGTRDFSDIAALGFEDSLWFGAGPEQTVTEEIGSVGLARVGVRP